MSENRLGGVVAAVPTPIDAHGEPDCELFLRHARWALDNGCDGLNVLGTTGEANSLSADQRRIVMRAAAGALPRDRLMVGTGTPDLATTVALTRLAAEAGFAAALVLPPYYYKPVSDDGLFAWFETLFTQTAETPVSVYLYNFPQLTGIAFTEELARRLLEAFPDRMRGMKDSSGDLDYAARMAKIAQFDVFPSSETALARAAADGYVGCISATVNINAPQSARLWADAGNADALQSVTDSRGRIASVPLVPAVKALIADRLDAPDFARVLPPLCRLDDDQLAEISDLVR